jgi:hypothetical protein
MRKLFTMLGLFMMVLMLFTGCTENARVKKWGGSATIDLPVGQKLVNVTWKDQTLWILTRQADIGELPKTFTFYEKSSLGVIEGSYTIKETPGVSRLHVDPGSTASDNSYINLTQRLNLTNTDNTLDNLINLHEDPGNQVKL